MVIALIPWQEKRRNILLSGRVVNSLMGYFTDTRLGIATAYAGRRKFYRVGCSTHLPHGTDALIVYAGSLLWLVTIVFAFSGLWLDITRCQLICRRASAES
jgi:hypothetical protein